jgi:hypothetical protein
MPWFTTKGQACQLAVAVLALLLATFKGWSDMKPASWAILAYVLLGVVLVSAVQLIASLRKRPAPALSLPQRMLFEEADLLHRIYRGLDQDHRELVRLPLRNSSWPAFGKEWSYVEVTLYSMSQRVLWLSSVGKKAFQEMHWATDSVELFRIGESVLMADLLHALEEFRLLLRSRF